jgi:hypothetical protein
MAAITEYDSIVREARLVRPRRQSMDLVDIAIKDG